jgi:glycosyltransferase involved in cell wall biosynthesis
MRGVSAAQLSGVVMPLLPFGHDLQVSIVIPLHNEQDNVAPLYQRIKESLTLTQWSYEIIFVDDGSTDETLPLLRSVAEADPCVRVVKLRKNFGQTEAMRAGIDYARGGMVVTMDGDLQNDPRDIPRLLEKVAEGYDLVTGWRRDRKDPVISRKLPSKVANWLIRKVTGVPIHDTGCSLKAYRAELIKRVPLYADFHRFIPAVCVAAGARVAEVVVQHHPRQAGRSKYGLSRIGKVALDLFTVKMVMAFSRKPLQWFGLLAAPVLAVAVAAGLLAAHQYAFADREDQTIVWPLTALLLAFLAARMLLTGVLGELIVRTDHSQSTDHLPLWHRQRIKPTL